MVEYEHKLLCNVCGSTSAPEGSRFCPDCGNNLGVPNDNNNNDNLNPPMAAAVPVVIDEEERVNIAVMNSTVNTDGAVAATPVVGSQQSNGMMSAMYFKNPSSEMLRQTSSNSAYGGVLFIEMSCPKGKYTLPKFVHVGQVLNGQKLDLSYADFVYPITTISVGTVLGGCKVIVPRGVRVETKGLGILGGFKGLSSTAIHAGQDAPTLVVQGVSILGGVKVTVNTNVPPVRVVP